MSFSERNGFKNIRQELQSESMNSNLKNSLWNVFYKNFNTIIDELYDDLICDFFKESLEIKKNEFEFLDGNKTILNNLIQKFFKLEWFEVYDLIEFLSNMEYFTKGDVYAKKRFKKFSENVNIYLEREFSAYRLVDNIVVKITNEIEIKAIEDALNIKAIRFESSQNHLLTALKKLSDKKNPDYRNSIKESISGVEACCRILTGENTLGKALDNLEKNGLNVNGQLKQGFDKLYAYTNSKDSGIRHAMIEKGNEPDFEDAKYMLISCSAFINYLISKSEINFLISLMVPGTIKFKDFNSLLGFFD